MAKITQAEIAKTIPEVIKAGGGEVPAWLTTIDKIVAGVNKMFESYSQIAGRTKGNTAIPTMENQSPLAGGRRLSAPLATKPVMPEQIVKKDVPMQNDDFKELIEGLIKTTRTMQAMGFGERKLGEVLLELPFTLNQTEAFLAKMYAAKYQTQ